jgi:hypothetical protein
MASGSWERAGAGWRVADKPPVASVALSLAFLSGILLLSVGAFLAYEPAGLIVAGFFLVVVPVLYIRGGLARASR